MLIGQAPQLRPVILSIQALIITPKIAKDLE